MASVLAHLILGKKRADFSPHWVSPVWIIVVNAAEMDFSKDKVSKKIYRHHTGYSGGLKEKTLGKRMEEDPVSLLRDMVKGMLPRNALRRTVLSHLKIYKGSEHPHGGQKPQILKI